MKLDQEALGGFATRAIHVGSDPDPSTGAVIPAISLSTIYKQEGIRKNKGMAISAISAIHRNSTELMVT